jgi:hypothetical protein
MTLTVIKERKPYLNPDSDLDPTGQSEDRDIEASGSAMHDK